jgi:hypothetical protein
LVLWQNGLLIERDIEDFQTLETQCLDGLHQNALEDHQNPQNACITSTEIKETTDQVTCGFLRIKKPMMLSTEEIRKGQDGGEKNEKEKSKEKEEG